MCSSRCSVRRCCITKSAMSSTRMVPRFTISLADFTGWMACYCFTLVVLATVVREKADSRLTITANIQAVEKSGSDFLHLNVTNNSEIFVKRNGTIFWIENLEIPVTTQRTSPNAQGFLLIHMLAFMFFEIILFIIIKCFVQMFFV